MSDPLALDNFVATLLVFGAPVGSMLVENRRFRGDIRRRWSDPTYWQLEAWQIAGLVLGVLPREASSRCGSARERVDLARTRVRSRAGGRSPTLVGDPNTGRTFHAQPPGGGGPAVVVDGPYRYLRHPSYTGAILMFAGIGIGLGNVLEPRDLRCVPRDRLRPANPGRGGAPETTAGRAVRRVREPHSTPASRRLVTVPGHSPQATFPHTRAATLPTSGR